MERMTASAFGAWLGIIVLKFCRRCHDFYICDFSEFDDEFLTGGASVKGDEKNTPLGRQIFLRNSLRGIWEERKDKREYEKCEDEEMPAFAEKFFHKRSPIL